jgi:hypothetical protein
MLHGVNTNYVTYKAENAGKCAVRVIAKELHRIVVSAVNSTERPFSEDTLMSYCGSVMPKITMLLKIKLEVRNGRMGHIKPMFFGMV